MKNFLLFLLVLLSVNLSAQNSSSVREMSWDSNFKIKVKLANDSLHILDVEKLHHSSGKISVSSPVYYPVALTQNFVEQLKGKAFETEKEDTGNIGKVKYTTLWNAVHSRIGGGWGHFLNCFLFALETNQLNVKAPLMMRPEKRWKPKPVTESYKRTKKWKYYIPVNQKLAIKEYYKRKKKDQLGDVKLLPEEFIQLFLNTNNSEYEKLRKSNDHKTRAKIDLVKILLGANYLGETQILYMSTAVLKSAIKYSANLMPSVIVLDDLNAAVALTLDASGYKIERIVFRDIEEVTTEELDVRKTAIHSLIKNINEVNKKLFENRLKSYYKKMTVKG